MRLCILQIHWVSARDLCKSIRYALVHIANPPGKRSCILQVYGRASKANAANRSKLEVNHTSGSKSYCQCMYEMGQMKALHAQPTENDIPLTGREIFQEVVKPKSRYAHGLGYGARHLARPRSTTRFHVEGNDSERESRQVLEQKIGSQQAQIESQQDQIGILQLSHASLEAQIRDLLGRLEARDTPHSNP
ncbi:hypothetical protein CDL15_Pgr029210 [Punica granatum]|uniref:Uncharacterized protein n=1 Tax=Punica granatum TaxID=22663 RepID=A0A218XDS6_PUNGR|nr:hypothetical protein CDL15_Pgr029210 [Punica granatum]